MGYFNKNDRKKSGRKLEVDWFVHIHIVDTRYITFKFCIFSISFVIITDVCWISFVPLLDMIPSIKTTQQTTQRNKKKKKKKTFSLKKSFEGWNASQIFFSLFVIQLSTFKTMEREKRRMKKVGHFVFLF